MAEYIKREDLLKRLEVTPILRDGVLYHVRDGVLDLVSKQPAADVAPVVHGRWERSWVDRSDVMLNTICSRCGGVVYDRDFIFCPHCGAKMEGGD